MACPTYTQNRALLLPSLQFVKIPCRDLVVFLRIASTTRGHAAGNHANNVSIQLLVPTMVSKKASEAHFLSCCVRPFDYRKDTPYQPIGVVFSALAHGRRYGHWRQQLCCRLQNFCVNRGALPSKCSRPIALRPHQTARKLRVVESQMQICGTSGEAWDHMVERGSFASNCALLRQTRAGQWWLWPWRALYLHSRQGSTKIRWSLSTQSWKTSGPCSPLSQLKRLQRIELIKQINPPRSSKSKTRKPSRS